MAPVGILLAAGRGRRFDSTGSRNKLLQTLPGGVAVVAASARALLAVLPRVVAVVRPGEPGVADLLADLGCEVTVCADADGGMANSLVHALRHALRYAGPDAPAVLVALGDMPHVRASTVQALCEALAAGAGIAAPVCGGARGNPVAFAACHLPALLALAGDQGARAIVQANPVTAVQVDDPGIFDDIDTPADLGKNEPLSEGERA